MGKMQIRYAALKIINVDKLRDVVAVQERKGQGGVQEVVCNDVQLWLRLLCRSDRCWIELGSSGTAEEISSSTMSPNLDVSEAE